MSWYDGTGYADNDVITVTVCCQLYENVPNK